MIVRVTFFLLMSIFSTNAISGDSILAELDKTPAQEQNEKWNDDRTYHWLNASDLRECLKHLYFGDKSKAIQSYKEAHQRIKDRVYKDIPYLVEHSMPRYSIVEKDGYYFIEKDDEPDGFVRVLIKKKKERLSSILIPTKEFDNFLQKSKKEGIEVNKLYAVRPDKEIDDPITELLETDDRYFSRELVDRIHKTVEYRRSKWKLFNWSKE